MGTNWWSYKHITDHSGEKIRELMVMATAETVPVEETRIYRNFAYGVYLMWYSLTCGYQKDGDNERMLALTERSQDTDTSI